MGRSKAQRALSRVATKAPLVWADDGLSFKVEQEASGLNDDNVHEWVTAAEEAFRTELPERQAAAADKGEERPVYCSVADFSNNQLGDSGAEKIIDLFIQIKVPILIARFFKNRLTDEGADSLARLLRSLPEPLEELHVSHNRLTSLGAARLLIAASDAGCPPSGPPSWLRLENNTIEWEPVTKRLEAQQVRWAASETRSQGARLSSTNGRKKRAFGPDAGPPQVLVHRSYRHQANGNQAGKEALARGKATAAGATAAAASGPRYEAHELLFMRHLIKAASAADAEGSHVATAGLRCAAVGQERSPASAQAEADLAEAFVQPKPLQTGGKENTTKDPAATETPNGRKGRPLCLEEYLKAELPPAPLDPSEDPLSWNCEAPVFVPTTPNAIKELNASAVEFKPSAAADSTSVLKPTAAEFTPSVEVIAEVAAEAAAAVAAAAISGGTMKVADLARLLAGPPNLPPPTTPAETKASPPTLALNPFATEFRPQSSSTSQSASTASGSSSSPESKAAVGAKTAAGTGTGSGSTSAADEDVSMEEVCVEEESGGCTQS